MKRIVFKKFAGVKIKGKTKIPLPITSKHIDRAVWLTACVESGGKFGCVMNYDGTGMTASIGQAIAVYPRALNDDIKRNDQGPLWKVLHRIRSSIDRSEYFDELNVIKNELEMIGWFISEDGKCRFLETGKLVSGSEIRKEFTGSTNGVMPIKGYAKNRAEYWVKLFHGLFSHPKTFPIQLAIEAEHFVKRCDRTKLRFCSDPINKKETLQRLIYDDLDGHISSVTTLQMGAELDLAMSMYWSNSVNAPSFALKKFCKQIIDKAYYALSNEELARIIIRKFGNTPFARWDDDLPNGRYQRTRRYAMKLWPDRLFVGKDAIMPKDL